MSLFSLHEENIKSLIEISMMAGSAIMDIYETDFDFENKKDQSPLTKADIISHEIISRSLVKLSPNIPIISEESSTIPFSERIGWGDYWLVDPLDGTKEFIKRNGEFTVNIALIYKGNPIMGVIYVPVKEDLYFSLEGIGSYKKAACNECIDNVENLILESISLPIFSKRD